MIRSLIVAFTLFGHSCAYAQVDSAPTYRELTNGWSIRVSGDYCVAVTTYQDGDNLMIAYEPAHNRAMVSISDRDSSSLQEGDRVELHVLFVGGRRLDEDWGSVGFNVYKNDGVSQMVGVFDGREMLRDIARYELIAFSVDGTTERLVGSYSLKGSAAAMEALRRCSFEASGLNINDPFVR